MGGIIELFETAPYIDFHYNNSTTDYTHRIIADANGLTVKGGDLVNDNRFRIYQNNQTKASFGIATDGSTVRIDTRSNGATFRYVENEAAFTSISASAFNQMSSRRYKKNIEDVTEERANKILAVDVKTFDYKEEMNGTDMVGVIAEELYELIPEAVTLTEINGEMVPDSVDYSKLVPYFNFLYNP